jgi:hypothetical protein
MAALVIGICSEILLVKRLRTSTSRGNISEYAGTSRMSSNVKPSWIMVFAMAVLL